MFDAVLLQDAVQAEDLAVSGGEAFLQLVDRGLPGGPFFAELAGEDVHDVAVCVVRGALVGGSGCARLLGA